MCEAPVLEKEACAGMEVWCEPSSYKAEGCDKKLRECVLNTLGTNSSRSAGPFGDEDDGAGAGETRKGEGAITDLVEQGADVHASRAMYVDEHLYNIQCSDSYLHWRYEKLHTDT